MSIVVHVHANNYNNKCMQLISIDTQVVCRQLGYDIALEARSGAYYGQGSGQIWLNNVTCVSNELTIEDCSHDGWGVHDCTHSKDAGVKCAASIGKLFTTIYYSA